MHQNPGLPPMLVAVPTTAVADLTARSLATLLPDARSSVLDAVVAIGTDVGTVVTLIQGPDAVRALAEWIRGLFARTGTSVQIVARRGDRRVKLSVDGDVPLDTVAKFLTAAFNDEENL
jgi:hypothetical protein